MHKPDFLIIGAMKCGTTSLHDYLGLHPDIYTTSPKEIHFFNSESYHKNKFKEYCQNFVSDKKLSGTTPQNYTKRHREDFSGIPGRIKSHLPDIKLIYIIRDPIDRIKSHYNEAQEGGYAPELGLNASILKEKMNHHYIRTSMYYYQIEAYLEYFSSDQILIVESEDLMDNRLKTLNTIFSFLGVTNLDEQNMFEFQKNSFNDKRKNNLLGNWVYGDNSALARAILPRWVKNLIKKSSIFNVLSKRSVEKEELTEFSTNLIKDILKDDVEKLRVYTGCSFAKWSL